MELLLVAGGIYHLCWAAFDTFWPHFFAWRRTLAALDDINRSLLYILSRLLVLLYLYVATVSFCYRRELLGSALGKTLLTFVAVYWGFRALMQVQFFGFARANRMNISVSELNFPPPINRLSNRTVSIGFFIIMLIGTTLYLVAAVS